MDSTTTTTAEMENMVLNGTGIGGGAGADDPGGYNFSSNYDYDLYNNVSSTISSTTELYNTGQMALDQSPASASFAASAVAATAQASVQEHEQRFMNIMDFSDDMLALLELQDSEHVVSSKCMASMYELGQTYKSVHGYISLVVCIAGILMNILIIMVLTRKEMKTPINKMLVALAVADMLVMIEYIPFTLHMYIFELPQEEQYSYPWAVFVLFHSHFTQVLHTINIQLTITMSIWRYVALKRTGHSSNSLTMSRCNVVIILAYIAPIFICIPNYLTFSIYHRQVLVVQPPLAQFLKVNEVALGMEASIINLCMYASDIAGLVMDCGSNAVAKHDWYTVGLSQMATANNELLHGINFWFYSVFVKLIPCLVLAFFVGWLINTLYKAKKRHAMLLQRNSCVPLATASIGGGYSSLEPERNGIRKNSQSQQPQSQSQTLNNQQLHLLNGRNSLGNALIEEKDEEDTTTSHGRDGGVIDDDKSQSQSQDERNKGTAEASMQQQPSVIYTPVSPLMSQGAAATAFTATNPSYSRIAYTSIVPTTVVDDMRMRNREFCQMSNGNGIIHGNTNGIMNPRRESNFSVRIPSAETSLIPAAPRQMSISFQDSAAAVDHERRSVGLRRFFRSSRKESLHTEADEQELHERHRRSSSITTITNNNMAGLPPRSRYSFGGSSTRKSSKRSDRTSKLLIAVLCLFLLTEFPQGIMAFLSGVYGEQFFKKCYNTWAEVWDILALINSGINFILYCFMSKQFRLQFGKLLQIGDVFKRKCSIHAGGGKGKDKHGGGGTSMAVVNHQHSVVPTIV